LNFIKLSCAVALWCVVIAHFKTDVTLLMGRENYDFDQWKMKSIKQNGAIRYCQVTVRMENVAALYTTSLRKEQNVLADRTSLNLKETIP